MTTKENDNQDNNNEDNNNEDNNNEDNNNEHYDSEDSGNWVRHAKCHWSSLSIDLGPKMFLNFQPNNGDLSQTFSDAFTSHLQWNKKLKL